MIRVVLRNFSRVTCPASGFVNTADDFHNSKYIHASGAKMALYLDFITFCLPIANVIVYMARGVFFVGYIISQLWNYDQAERGIMCNYSSCGSVLLRCAVVDLNIEITDFTWKNIVPFFSDMLDMLVIDISFRRSCLVFFLTPSKYGTHKLWYFPVLPSYWLSCFSSCANYLAPDPMNSGPKRAVDNLNLTMFAGHYGAGKTTTIVMLTGLIPVDSGSAVIEGHDVGREIDTIRKKPAARFPISSVDP
eukprot:gene34885-45143_t